MVEEYVTYPVKIKVISQKGYCAWGHKVGDEWVYAFQPGNPEYPGICPSAFYAMFKNIWLLWFGGQFAWPTPDPDICNILCPDADNPCAFQLKRLRDQPIHFHYNR